MTPVGHSMGHSLWFRDLFFGERAATSPLEYARQLLEEGVEAAVVPASPLMHGAGLVFASLPALSTGGQVITLPSPSFDAHELLATVEADSVAVVAIAGDAFALPILRALDTGHRDGRG